MKPDQRVFVGVVAPIDPHVETPEEVRDRVLEAAEYIPLEQLGTTDDCGFSPFCDDTSTSRDTAFAKIRARVRGTALAAEALGAQLVADCTTTRNELLRSVALQNAEQHSARPPARRGGALRAPRKRCARAKSACARSFNQAARRASPIAGARRPASST